MADSAAATITPGYEFPQILRPARNFVCFRSDLQSQELLVELKPGMARGSGHSSRVFSVKFHPEDSNVVVSGGWVRTLPLLREKSLSAA